MLAAVVLVICTIVIPARLWSKRQSGGRAAPAGGIVYFIAIGTGFMFVEMAMMQQLSIFLGHPIYAMVVALGGLDSVGGTGQPGLGTEQPELSAPSWRFSYRWIPRSGPAC